MMNGLEASGLQAGSSKQAELESRTKIRVYHQDYPDYPWAAVSHTALHSGGGALVLRHQLCRRGLHSVISPSNKARDLDNNF